MEVTSREMSNYTSKFYGNLPPTEVTKETVEMNNFIATLDDAKKTMVRFFKPRMVMKLGV